MLHVCSVNKSYGSLVALKAVSLEIRQGEIFGLLGPNGAGKSTLMSLVAGLRLPDSGEIHVEGQRLTSANPEARRSVGLVPQNIALYQEMTAEQNLRTFGGIYGLRGPALSQRVDELLEAVQLSDRRRHPVKTFSGGMQRRLNLAASLLHRPRLLLCDEPTVGVDPQSRNAIFDHLQRLNREGLTIIYSTHYMEEAERLCTRIGVIDHGAILALGTQDTLLANLPFEEEVTFAASADSKPLIQVLQERAQVHVLDGLARFRPSKDCPLSFFYAEAERLGLPSRSFTHERPSLEAVFLHLTGRTLRD